MLSGTGEIAGLLRVRGVNDPAVGADASSPFDAVGDIPNLASRVEAITIDLLTRVNEEYVGPDADGGTPAHQVSSYNLNGAAANTVGNRPGMAALFTFGGIASLGAFPNPVQPANFPHNSTAFFDYSSRLEFNVSNPVDIAAGRDVNSATVAVDTSVGDGQNAAAMATLRLDQTATFNVGNFSYTGSVEDVYDRTVFEAGVLSKTAKDEFQVFKARQDQIEEFQQSVSGVNLDEEFAKLINFQRAFEASARLVRVGDDLFGQIIGLLG
jgi:flagellar hook-associated protein FlgK